VSGKQRSFVKYKQKYGELDVFGAESVVQVEGTDGVAFVLSAISDDLSDLETGRYRPVRT